MPLGFVIVLSVFLISSVVTIVDSIDLTVLTIYNYTRFYNPVVPRAGRLKIDSDIEKQIKTIPGVDRTIDATGFFMNVNTVFGPSPFICFGLPVADRDYLVKRAGDNLIAGRWPKPGAPEVAVSEGLVRNKGSKLGDIVAGPDDTGTLVPSPVPVRLVGIIGGPTWMAYTSQEFVLEQLPLVPHSELVVGKTAGDQLKLGDYLISHLDKSRVEVFTYHSLVTILRKSLKSMYLIMALVNGTVIFVVALMAGMLSSIYFQQRVVEFAVLAAIGVQRTQLILQAVGETAILTGLGWVIGIIVNITAMSIMSGTVFEPRGMLINARDPFALAYTIPIPVCITLFAVGTVWYRLAKMDPVTIIERR